MAVVSCRVGSLVSISNTAPPILINGQRSRPADMWELCPMGRRLQMQHAPKNEKATKRRMGPMMMGGLFKGRSLVKARAPTRVMLMPASMMQSPQAQQRAGEGNPWERSALLSPDCASSLEKTILSKCRWPFRPLHKKGKWEREKTEKEVESSNEYYSNVLVLQHPPSCSCVMPAPALSRAKNSISASKTRWVWWCERFGCEEITLL